MFEFVLKVATLKRIFSPFTVSAYTQDEAEAIF